MALVIAIFVAAWIWISTSKNVKYCHNATTKCKLRCIVITLTLILVHMLSIWQNSFPFPWPKCRCFISKSLVSLQHVTCIKAFWKIVLFRLSFIWLTLVLPRDGTKNFLVPGSLCPKTRAGTKILGQTPLFWDKMNFYFSNCSKKILERHFLFKIMLFLF